MTEDGFFTSQTHTYLYTPQTYEDYYFTKQGMTDQVLHITNIYIHMYITNTGTKN